MGGRRAALEAVRSGRARRLLIARGAHGTAGLRELIDAARQAGLSAEHVEQGALDGLGVRDHQGVAVIVDLPTEIGERGLASLDLPPNSLAVVLDGVQDPQNFGACARSAEAAGAGLLVCRTRRAAPMTAAAVRASAGALLHLPVARVTNIARSIESLRERGFFVAGLDHRADVAIHEAPSPSRPLAVVVGAEGSGLSRLVRERCDLLVRIPMQGRTGSLNAAAALSVALFGYALR